MTQALPDVSKLVLARMEGASHHTGDYPAWHREGWVFLVRWNDAPNTVADGWARDRYEAALKQIDADYANVKEWIYVDDLQRAGIALNALAGIPSDQIERDAPLYAHVREIELRLRAVVEAYREFRKAHDQYLDGSPETTRRRDLLQSASDLAISFLDQIGETQ